MIQGLAHMICSYHLRAALDSWRKGGIYRAILYSCDVFSTILEAHNYDAGVIITASHLPYERNGFKFFTKSGGFERRHFYYIKNMPRNLTVQA